MVFNYQKVVFNYQKVVFKSKKRLKYWGFLPYKYLKYLKYVYLSSEPSAHELIQPTFFLFLFFTSDEIYFDSYLVTNQAVLIFFDTHCSQRSQECLVLALAF